MRISDGSSDVCSSDLVAARVMGLIGFGDRADLATFAGRIAARDEIDARMAEWCRARPLAEVLDAFESAEAAAAPVYSMADRATDPPYKAPRGRARGGERGCQYVCI